MSKKTCFFHENHRFRLFYGCFEADRPRNNAISLRKQRTLHTISGLQQTIAEQQQTIAELQQTIAELQVRSACAAWQMGLWSKWRRREE